MRSPTLNELPCPPHGKTGWPWTEKSPQMPDIMSDGSPWPRISIVTPSLNQGQYIEETIRSVLLQGYPNIEYIIIDGGSTDGTIKIIKKYEKWLTYWVSEPDKGQSHAINQGISKCNGDVFAWINSDDLYLPSAFSHVSKEYVFNRNSIIAGNVINFSSFNGESCLIRQNGITFRNMVAFWERKDFAYHQPGLFFPAYLIKKVGKLDEDLNYCMDYDLLCRLLQICSIVYVDKIFARFRIHEQSKTGAYKPHFRKEIGRVANRYCHLATKLSKKLANDHIAKFLITTAIHELRRGDYKIFKELLLESWYINKHRTIKAILKEILRLGLGGRYTGFTLH